MNTRRRIPSSVSRRLTPALSASAIALALVASSHGAALAQDAEDPAPAGEEIVHSFTLTPGDDATGNRSNLSYTADPGAVLEDSVTIFNLGNEQLTFRVYATDAFNAEDGSLSLLAGNEPPSDIGTWVTFPQDLLTVPPRQQVTMPITISVPANAAPGDHTGAILVSSEALSPDESGTPVVLDRRTGTRLLVRVSGPVRPELAIEDLSASYRQSVNPFGGSAEVTFTIQNRGNVRLSGTHAVVVKGPFGVGTKRAAAVDFPELLPGQGIEVTAIVDDVPALFLASATVELIPNPEGDGATVAPSERSTRAFAPPITVLLVALLLFFGWLARRAYRRHRGREVITEVEVILPEREKQLT
jgi:hypothetical protein